MGKATKIPFETVEERTAFLKNVSYVDLVRELITRGAMKTLERHTVIPVEVMQRYANAKARVVVPSLGDNAAVQFEAANMVRTYSLDLLSEGLLDVACEPSHEGTPGDQLVKVSMLVLFPGYTEEHS